MRLNANWPPLKGHTRWSSIWSAKRLTRRACRSVDGMHLLELHYVWCGVLFSKHVHCLVPKVPVIDTQHAWMALTWLAVWRHQESLSELVANAAKTSPALDVHSEPMQHLDATMMQLDHGQHAEARSSGQVTGVPAVSKLRQNPQARRKALVDKENQQPALPLENVAF